MYEQDGQPRQGITIKDYYDGSKFEGGLTDGKRNGKGIYAYKNGDVYVGDWKDDKFHGYGRRKLTRFLHIREWRKIPRRAIRRI